jgi:hypothetical protein
VTKSGVPLQVAWEPCPKRLFRRGRWLVCSFSDATHDGPCDFWAPVITAVGVD